MPKSYPFQWSLDIFQQFDEAHPKANLFFLKMYKLSYTDVVKWIQTGSRSWDRWKYSVKRFEQNEASYRDHYERKFKLAHPGVSFFIYVKKFVLIDLDLYEKEKRLDKQGFLFED